MARSETVLGDTVVASGLVVRIAVVTCLVSAVPAVLGFQLFASHLGQTSRDVVSAATCQDGSCGQSETVRRTVAVLEDDGLDCRARPALTDSVVFEWKTTEVSVVDFATALRATSNSEGWVRRYCTPR
jgi:hypothetical protein